MKTNAINSKETTRVYAAERMGVHIRLDRHHRKGESPWYSASAILPERGLYLMTAGSTRLKAADQLDRELRRRVELGPSAGAVEALLTALSEEAQREAERRKQMETEEFRDTVRRGFCPYCGSQKEMDYRRDAYDCPHCDEWLETACRDPNCSFCRGRAAHPSEDRANQRFDPIRTKQPVGSLDSRRP